MDYSKGGGQGTALCRSPTGLLQFPQFLCSMTKTRELDEVQRQDADVNRRHYGEDVKFYQYLRRKLTSKSLKMDKNLYEKCVIYIQVHSREDVKSLLSQFFHPLIINLFESV